MVAAVIVALTLRFSTGLLAFKVKSRWCPGCGEKMCCIRCEEVGSGSPRPARQS